MNIARATAALALLAAAGCWPAHPAAPEEDALDVYEDAEALFKKGRYEDAAPGYEFVIKARDRWRDPYVKLALCHEAAGRDRQAVAVLERLLVVDRTDAEGLKLLAKINARLEAAGKP